MIAKATTIGLVGLLTVSLIGGTAYILLRPTDGLAAANGPGYTRAEETTGEQGYGYQGTGRATGAEDTSRGRGPAELGTGNGGGSGRTTGEGAQQGNSYRSSSQKSASGRGRTPGLSAGSAVGQANGGAGDGVSLADHPSETWEILEGTVLELEGNALTLDTLDGPSEVHLGPEWYWEAQAVAIAIGDAVEVEGFYEGDAFEVAQITNLSNGDTAILRDETGRPLWAGRGRGRGRVSAAGG